MATPLARFLPLAALVACGGTPAFSVAPAHVASAPPPAFHDGARRTRLAAEAPKLDAFFAELQKKEEIPGLAVGLVVDGDLVWSNGYGKRDVTGSSPVDADTVFRIGSITKTFTAVAALELRDEGRLSLDAPATAYVSELGDVVYPTNDSPQITMESLLTHTAGLPRLGNFSYVDPKRAPTEKEILEGLRGLPLPYAPGTRSVYSNLGAALAGIVVGRAAGMPYRDYVTTRLLRPLGMASTTWDEEAVPKDRLATAYSRGEKAPKREEHWRLGASEGAGGLYSSVRDLARWTALHLDAFPPRDAKEVGPVRRATLREAMSVHFMDGMRVRAVEPSVEARADGIGYGWHVFEDCDLDRVVWHNGGTEGYSSMVAMMPRRGVAIIALANMAGVDLDEPARDALALLQRDKTIPARELVPPPALGEARERLVALYSRWDDAEAARLFSPAFVSSSDLGGRGLAAVKEHFDEVRARHGACRRAAEEVDASSLTEGHLPLACERGAIGFDVSLASLAPLAVRNFSVSEQSAPSEALGKAAGRIAALSESWDDATFEELLFPTFEKEEMKAFFAKVRSGHGACTVGSPFGGDGAHQAKWHLTCAKAPADLTIMLDTANGRVGGMVIRRPQHEDGRCPG